LVIAIKSSIARNSELESHHQMASNRPLMLDKCDEISFNGLQDNAILHTAWQNHGRASKSHQKKQCSGPPFEALSPEE
jgi:hypothetical protein